MMQDSEDSKFHVWLDNKLIKCLIKYMDKVNPLMMMWHNI